VINTHVPPKFELPEAADEETQRLDVGTVEHLDAEALLTLEKPAGSDLEVELDEKPAGSDLEVELDDGDNRLIKKMENIAARIDLKNQESLIWFREHFRLCNVVAYICIYTVLDLWAFDKVLFIVALYCLVCRGLA
jgi:hypothetical protein